MHIPATTILASSIFTPIAKPIADVLAAFYALIPNYGVAIILLSVAWMLIIAPLTLKSTRSMLAMQKLQPQLKKLQAEHKNDRQAFAAAQMELFKEHNVSPFGSCLPTLLPLPVFFALFRVIDGLSHHTTIHGVSTPTPSFLSPHTAMYKAIVAGHGNINAFGLDLAKNALSGHSSFTAALPFYVLLLIMIGTQYLQTAQMMSRNPAANDNPQMKMMKYLPIFFGVICIRFPAGVILYYAMSNICRMAQQTAMYRYDPKVRQLVAQEVTEVEAITRDIDRSNASGKARKQADTPPARQSRFRDALNQATKQAQENRERNKSGATTSPSGSRPAARNRPANGKPAANGKAAANGKPAANGKAAANGRPAGSGRPAANGKAGTSGRPTGNGNGKSAANGKAAATAKPAANGTGNGAAKPATNGTGNGSAKPAANGNGKSAPSGSPVANGNGKSAPNGDATPAPVAAGNGSNTGNGAGNGTTNGNGNGGPKPSRTGAGSGRTGASQSRKRRGR